MEASLNPARAKTDSFAPPRLRGILESRLCVWAGRGHPVSMEAIVTAEFARGREVGRPAPQAFPIPHPATPTLGLREAVRADTAIPSVTVKIRAKLQGFREQRALPVIRLPERDQRGEGPGAMPATCAAEEFASRETLLSSPHAGLTRLAFLPSRARGQLVFAPHPKPLVLVLIFQTRTLAEALTGTAAPPDCVATFLVLVFTGTLDWLWRWLPKNQRETYPCWLLMASVRAGRDNLAGD